ncbi:MAG: hydrogenase expression/formation protein HypE [Acidobacteria bacterium]|nr:hydrogenase expression/formation protein HypE [Acidobacteriota bacterium]MCB9397630.1 hydrogenase expression/formation protein HypE [Acidobacteriota bacterium]
MVHGAGGLAMAQLIDHIFLPAFANPDLDLREDATLLSIGAEQIAITTDSFVVDPLFFPGGDIGTLAVNGTVNDLAVRGAKPLYLTAGFILEEGLALEDLKRIVASMSQAARAAGVKWVAGDTKVVPNGKGDKVFINTTGIGSLATGNALSCHNIKPGDALLVSGCLGDHGIAVLAQRPGLQFDTKIESDCASVVNLVQAVQQAIGPDFHACRDATRGGLTAVLNEFAQASGCSLNIEESAIPVRPAVRSACEMLGLDPFSIANEGKIVLAVAQEAAEKALAVLRVQTLGSDAALIGKATTGPAEVILKTAFGTHRILDLPVGEPLPRIC